MSNIGPILLALLQAVVLLALAPFFTGMSRQIRARMHSRRGPGVLQDYRDLVKLLKRQSVAPEASGFVFRGMPYLMLGVMFVLAMALPVFTRQSPLSPVADIITFAYLFALSRFFFSLSGVDSGSSFAGLGGAREAMLGILVEPFMILSLLVVALVEGTTSIGALGSGIGNGYGQCPLAILLAMVAFGFAMFIEMGKLPFDVAEAEQELQEGPLTEYSGSSLAILKLGIGLKKLVVAQFFIGVFLPFGAIGANPGVMDVVIAVVALPVRLAVLFALAGLIENSMARTRYIMTSKVTWVGFGVAALSFVFYLAGL
jgi:hydrogenase-4 component C